MLAPLRITIDSSALAHNYSFFKTNTGVAVAGVVKANAYGLGVEHVVPVLEKLGCPFYFVATFSEAVEVRHHTQKPIAVLGGLSTATLPAFVQHGFVPVLNSAADCTAWYHQGQGKPAILHIDTGMNRLGISARDLTAQQVAGLNLLYVMSHFASADETEPRHIASTQYQHELFLAAVDRAGLDHVPKSIANTGGVFSSAAYAHALVRPGIGLYGGNPFGAQKELPLKPVVRVEARVLQTREVQADDVVGYGGSHTFTAPTTIATVALGYADGFQRAFSNKAALYWQGYKLPVVGRISMDLTTIDIGNHALQQGDWVEVVGPHQNVTTLAKQAGTIDYELLTQLSRRAERNAV